MLPPHHFCQVMVWVASAVISFAACSRVCWSLYGAQFWHEAYLYHLSRTDHRHNFSIWWYALYLTYDDPGFRRGLGLAALVPSAAFLAVSALALGQSLPLCMAFQTIIFVHTNKVLTAQYFLWYMALLPIALPPEFSTKQFRRYFSQLPLLAWIVALSTWLILAYYLEFKGYEVWTPLWAASLGFQSAAVWTAVEFLRACATK